MNRLLVLALAAFASLAMVHADFADAARMGGGRSFGMQRSITPPAARTAPSTGNPAVSGPAANPVMPAKPGATAGNPAMAAAPAAAGAASRSSRWLGPIAGLAAGLGLAALFSHLGLSEGLGSLLLIGLLVVGAIVLFRAVRRSTRPQRFAINTRVRDRRRVHRSARPASRRSSPHGDRRQARRPRQGAIRRDSTRRRSPNRPSSSFVGCRRRTTRETASCSPT